VLSGSWDGTLRVWDPETSQKALTLLGHKSQVECVAISPDGQYLASAAGDWDGGGSRYVNGELRIWDAKSGRTVFNREAQASGVTCVAFSPDGRYLATRSGVWHDQQKQYASGAILLRVRTS